MRLPRNHKIFRGQLDAAPFACVFFLLTLFLVFHGGFVFTPGVPLKLPTAADFPGLTNQSAVVAVAANGICFYENQITSDNELKTKLRSAVTVSGPLTLVLQADRDVRYARLVELCLIARDAGIQDTLWAVRAETKPVAVPGSAISPSAPAVKPRPPR